MLRTLPLMDTSEWVCPFLICCVFSLLRHYLLNLLCNEEGVVPNAFKNHYTLNMQMQRSLGKMSPKLSEEKQDGARLMLLDNSDFLSQFITTTYIYIYIEILQHHTLKTFTTQKLKGLLWLF